MATSTGGTPNKLPGRVGDSPLVGSGAYADSELAGCSTTGWGESIMKICLAKTAVDFTENYKAGVACKKSLEKLERVKGLGGMIMINRYGEIAYDYNTPFMARAYGSVKNGVQHVGV